MRMGADLSLLDRDGRTALHLAAHTGDETILRVVLGMLGERHAHLVNCADFSGEISGGVYPFYSILLDILHG